MLGCDLRIVQSNRLYEDTQHLEDLAWQPSNGFFVALGVVFSDTMTEIDQVHRLMTLTMHSLTLHSLTLHSLTMHSLTMHSLTHTALTHTALTHTALTHTALTHTALTHTALTHTAPTHTALHSHCTHSHLSGARRGDRPGRREGGGRGEAS
jgi:hypothetical protein